mgnify:CR=1 FL=1
MDVRLAGEPTRSAVVKTTVKLVQVAQAMLAEQAETWVVS